MIWSQLRQVLGLVVSPVECLSHNKHCRTGICQIEAFVLVLNKVPFRPALDYPHGGGVVLLEFHSSIVNESVCVAEC